MQTTDKTQSDKNKYNKYVINEGHNSYAIHRIEARIQSLGENIYIYQ